jgi:hypothetical protein
MSLQMALAPVFVLVLLSFILLGAMGRARIGALKARQVKTSDIALGQKAWPDRAMQLSNAYSNQFEIPMLFYALVAIALPLRQMDLVMVLLAWVYVVLRYLHAGIYATSNNLNQRFSTFFASCLVLLAMWAYFAMKILLAAI